MSHRTLIALMLAAALGSGCGTVNNINKPTTAPANGPDAAVCRVYGGVREDADVFWHYPWNQTTQYVDYVAIPVLGVANLFFDCVGDTLTLPYTATVSAKRALFHSNPSSGYTPVAIPVALPLVQPAPTPAQIIQPALVPAPAAPSAPGSVPAVPAVPPPLPGSTIPQVTSPR